MKENKFHSTPYRFPGSLMIHNRHPWCHNPCHKGSDSHLPFHLHSNSSRLLRCRCHTKLVPGQYCRGSGIHRTGRPGYSGHSSLQVKSPSFGKRQHLLYSSYWCHCLQTSWSEFFYAFFEKRVLKVFDSLQIHVWPRGGFHCHCSDLGGHSLSCLFPPHFPVLQFEAEASAEVGFWWVHHPNNFPKWTGLASLHVWSSYRQLELSLSQYFLYHIFPGLGRPAGHRQPQPRAGAREPGLRPRRTWAAPLSPRRASA